MELLGSTIEFLSPVADFVGFVDIDTGPVGGASVLEVVGRKKEQLRENIATKPVEGKAGYMML